MSFCQRGGGYLLSEKIRKGSILQPKWDEALPSDVQGKIDPQHQFFGLQQPSVTNFFWGTPCSTYRVHNADDGDALRIGSLLARSVRVSLRCIPIVYNPVHLQLKAGMHGVRCTVHLQ